jgi:hypothetical protein
MFDNFIRAFSWYNSPLLDKMDESIYQQNLNELEKFLKTFKEKIGVLTSKNETLNSCEQNLLKRLEWASKSNPNLNEIIKSFENAKLKREYILSTEFKLAERVRYLVDTWYAFELCRANSFDSNTEQKLKEIFEK